MKISSIALKNFGSYEGETVFDTRPSSDDKNIILIGGKNGAGKTTLFIAMRLCLYGYMSMGYKNINSFYNRAISKLINNAAKMKKPAESYVALTVSINGNHASDTYLLKRQWILSDNLTETFSVDKNGMPLSDDEIADFEKFILTLIPPELFNLYFFDGEKIADFFMEEGGNTRVKDAFLTLCGYDTFEIMRKNFKRISSGATNTPSALNDYLHAKDMVEECKRHYQDLTARLKQCIDEVDLCESDLMALEKVYYQKGGISQEEWNKKLLLLKEEEKKRETLNSLLKKWANDIVPFLIIRDQIDAIGKQIESENREKKYKHFCEVLETPEIKALLQTSYEQIKAIAEVEFSSDENNILALSFEQSVSVLSQIKQILDFDTTKIGKCKKAIQRSLSTTSKVRKELENSSISYVQEYMKRRAELFEQKSLLLVQRIELEKQLVDASDTLAQAEAQFSKIQMQLEEELKKASITDISARAIVMLDQLQQTLYRKQIEKVEVFFRQDIKILMRKTRFIDDIYIDDSFNIHIYREESIPKDKLILALSTNTEAQIATIWGEKALKQISEFAPSSDWDGLVSYLEKTNFDELALDIEIDKMSLSNGEKQIFIMALYHSLVQLCNHEIPFIIDTPFARIDTEHRHNISKHFFCALSGQIFILSTNEEIDSDHVQIMKDHIAATFMLENSDNKRTVVVSNRYFKE